MKAIIFDIDGTLIESMSIDNELYFSAVTEVLGPVTIRDLHDYDHVTDSGVLAQVLEDNGYAIDSELAASVKSQFVAGLKRHIEVAGSFPVIDGAIQFFDRVRSLDDCRVAIATGGWRESALLKLECAGFRIDGIPVLTGDDAQSRVEIMRSALAMLGREFGSVTYFGDAEWDRRTCEELGWRFAAVG